MIYLGLNHVLTKFALFIDIWVEDFSCELEKWCLEWVILWEGDLQIEFSSLVCCTLCSCHNCMPSIFRDIHYISLLFGSAVIATP
jgi:hypothetical protein